MKTPQSPAPVAGDEDTRPASDQPVEAIGAGREEILPCPFCGTAAVVNRSERAVTVGCDFNDCPSRECFAAGRVAEEAGVISAWNTRAAPSPASPARTPMGGRPSDEQVRRAIQTRLHLHPTDETLGCLDRAVADIQALFAPPSVQPVEGK